jgi:uncharacterized protein (DUF1697 family)
LIDSVITPIVPQKPTFASSAILRSIFSSHDKPGPEQIRQYQAHLFADSSLHYAQVPQAAIAQVGLFLHNPGMALVVFLRGVNVGGHRTFRPSVLARELSDYDVVNVGAAGTFVVRKPGSRAKVRAALLLKLPFEAEAVLCEGRDLMRLEMENPFGPEPCPSDVVRFVSILSKAGGVRASLPVAFPSDAEWLVRVMASQGQFVFGMYRRHMKTIGYLGQIDKLYGVPATTRNWNTIVAILRILKGKKNTR